MNILSLQGIFSYCKIANTATPPMEICLRLRGVFEDFGKVLNATCSEPLKITNGKISYNLKVTIEVEQQHFAELDKFAHEEYWNRC